MNLKELRKENKKTQEEISQLLNVTPQSYSRYELEVSEPSIEALIKLADYYDVSLDYLVGRHYANEVGYMTLEQKEIVRMFLSLDEFNQAKVAGYIASRYQER